MFPSPGIGDILAICQLVVKIGTVIWDVTTNEVPKEFQELKEELRVLWEVLQSIKNINDTSLSLDATLALQRIQREAKSCEDAMNEFLKNNSPPESKTRRAVWMIRVTKKATLLREKLSIHRQNLGVFWNEFRHQQQADYNKKQLDHNKRQNDMLNQLLTLVAQHSATSNGQTNLLSQVLTLGREQATNSNGHTEALSQLQHTTGQLQDMAIEQAASLDSWRKELQILSPVIQGITLVDAVGSRMEIPFLFCRTYDLLSDVLLAIFKNDNRPGRNFVLRGDYNLVHGDAKDLISPSTWSSLLRSDLNVEMSMILRRDGAATDTCPRCQTSFHGDGSSVWATCLTCGAQFQIKQHIKEVEEPTNGWRNDEEIITPLVAALGQKPVSSYSSQESQPEWALFRLLSVVSTVFKLKSQGSIYDILDTTGPDLSGISTPMAHSISACPHHSSAECIRPADSTKLNLDLGTAWRAVRQHPQFEECDIDELCAELAQAAKCDGNGKVVEAQDIMDIVHSISERASRRRKNTPPVTNSPKSSLDAGEFRPSQSSATWPSYLKPNVNPSSLAQTTYDELFGGTATALNMAESDIEDLQPFSFLPDTHLSGGNKGRSLNGWYYANTERKAMPIFGDEQKTSSSESRNDVSGIQNTHLQPYIDEPTNAPLWGEFLADLGIV